MSATLNKRYGRLFLNRKQDQEVLIYLPNGDTIKIIHGGMVTPESIRLIIEAPKNINIARAEIARSKV